MVSRSDLPPRRPLFSCGPVPSLAVGVGHKLETQLPLPRVAIEGAVWFAFAVGVCNNPDPMSEVRGANRDSWNIKRPCGVAFAFQISEYFVQAQFDEPNNILSNNPSGPEFPDNSKHLRPEMSGVVLGKLSTRLGEWLTRESSANKVGSGVGEVELSGMYYVIQYRYVGPVVLQNRLAERILFHETGGAKMTRGFKSTGKSTNSGEQVNRR